MVTDSDIRTVIIFKTDGTKIKIKVPEEQGYFRESIMKGKDGTVNIQEVFIAGGIKRVVNAD